MSAIRCAECGTTWDDNPKNAGGRLCLACGYENPPTEPGKPSLAERIEALDATMGRCDHVVTANGEKIWILGDWQADLRAIAAELREIADSLIANGYSSNLYKIANRLAGKEGT